MIVWILLGLLIIAVIWAFGTYNRFVTLKTQIEASIQEIGNQLKRQADLIPNLISSVKGYMKHEKEIFQSITDARKQVMEVITKDGSDAQAIVDASSKLQQALAPIRAVLESTPELQAAAPTQKLMDELRDTADKIMYARRTLIDLTADYNIARVTVPSNIIATLFNFEKQPGLTMPEAAKATTVTAEETKTPKVEL
ncbi:MAG: LemA family protein [Patescibacteria group bacterium]|jgi:LemA protein